MPGFTMLFNSPPSHEDTDVCLSRPQIPDRPTNALVVPQLQDVREASSQAPSLPIQIHNPLGNVP